MRAGGIEPHIDIQPRQTRTERRIKGVVFGVAFQPGAEARHVQRIRSLRLKPNMLQPGAPFQHEFHTDIRECLMGAFAPMRFRQAQACTLFQDKQHTAMADGAAVARGHRLRESCHSYTAPETAGAGCVTFFK
jgi:hypothetical protein